MQKRKLPIIEEGNFQEIIHEAQKEKRHPAYLKKIVVDYEKYRQEFSKAFIDKNPLNGVYVFRVSYIRKTPVWRDIVIFGKQTFCNLAEAIIDWMGWDNDHMHGFSMKKVEGVPQHRYSQFSMYAPGWEDDPYPTFKTDQIKIADINYSMHPKWNFVFDFGDGHEFDIELKKIDEKAQEKDFDESLPTCIDQRGVAPIQYPAFEKDEENFKEWEYDDNCPHCQALKKSGIKLTRFPDENNAN